MGSGKSSIVEAVSFALFGTFPGLKSRRLELDHLIMKKPSQKSHCQVELEFSIDGKTYYVKRVVDRGKGTGHAEIRRDGEILNVNARGVTDEVVRALQMDYDLFSKAVYAEQNGLDYFLRIPKGSRKKEIDRMLKVDRFEKARSEAVTMRNKVKSRGEERSRLLADMGKEGIGEKMNTVKAELGKLEKERSRFQTDLIKIRKKAETISKKITLTEKTEKELNHTRVTFEGAKSSLKELNESLERLKKRFKDKDLHGLEADIKDKEGKIVVKRGKIKATQDEIENKRSELASVNSMIKIARDGAKGLEKAGAKCPVCDNDITASKREELIKKRQDEENTMMERAKSIAEGMAGLSKERDKLDENLKGMELDLEKMKGMVKEYGDLEDMAARKRDHQKQKDEASERMVLLEKELKEAGLDKLRKDKQALVAKESELMAKISGFQERLADKESILRELEGREALMEKYKREGERDTQIMEDLDKFEKVLKITQDQLRQEFLKTVNSIMADVWTELYPYGDFQDIRMAIEDDYVLQLKEPAGWVSVEGTISGGERSMATLTLRVAFSMAFLPNLKWLILDEPTHNLDANAIRQFASILREKMGLFADQVFLITHEERISEGVTGNLYRMERDKDKDEPTKIISM
jgi:exonuclease SbcC